jgi:hypothetical protein
VAGVLDVVVARHAQGTFHVKVLRPNLGRQAVGAQVNGARATGLAALHGKAFHHAVEHRFVEHAAPRQQQKIGFVHRRVIKQPHPDVA